MIVGMTHVGVVVPDIEKAIAFYRDIIGMNHRDGPRESKGGPNAGVVGYKFTHMKIAHMDSPDGSVLELIEYINPSPTVRADQRERSVIGATHISFEVDDVGRVWQEFIDAGGTKLMPVQTFPDGRQEAYLQDPFGNWVELDSHPQPTNIPKVGV